MDGAGVGDHRMGDDASSLLALRCARADQPRTDPLVREKLAPPKRSDSKEPGRRGARGPLPRACITAGGKQTVPPRDAR